jgi:hypothetical protein
MPSVRRSRRWRRVRFNLKRVAVAMAVSAYA